jgi:carbon starvation protein CstA
MINGLLRKFEKLDRDIEALSYVLIAFAFVLIFRILFLLYQCRFEELWTLFGPFTAIVAAMLVARVAKHLIANNNIIRENDRRINLVRVTHHLLAVTQDMFAQVEYVKIMLTSGKRPTFVFGKVAENIERRYETLLDRDAYQFLPGKCVDIIINMSGSVFGIGALAEGLNNITASNPMTAIDSVLPQDMTQQIAKLDQLMNKLQELITDLYEVRTSIDGQGAK